MEGRRLRDPDGSARTRLNQRRQNELCLSWVASCYLFDAHTPVLLSSLLVCCQNVTLGGLSDRNRFQHTVYFFIWICSNIARTDLVACRPSYAEAQSNSDASFLRRRREQVYGGNRFHHAFHTNAGGYDVAKHGGIRTAPCRSGQSSSLGGIGLAGF